MQENSKAKEVGIFSNIIHISLALALALAGHMKYSTLLYLGIAAGSILPNIDTPFAGGGRIYSVCMMLGKGRCMHRKCTHSLFSLICFSSLAYVWNPLFGAGVFFGYLLHILGDAAGSVSVPYLLWPYRYNPDYWYFKRT